MKVELSNKSVRLHDAMLEHDGLRRGKVPFKKFRTTLQKYNLELNNAVWDLLERHYQENTVDFNYANLQNDIDNISVDDLIEFNHNEIEDKLRLIKE